MNEVEGEGRYETGRMDISSEEWPGVYFRGDEALSYAQDLRAMAKAGMISADLIVPGSRLGGLIAILESCKVNEDAA